MANLSEAIFFSNEELKKSAEELSHRFIYVIGLITALNEGQILSPETEQRNKLIEVLIYNYTKLIKKSEEGNSIVYISELFIDLLLNSEEENKEAWQIVARNDYSDLSDEKKERVKEKIESINPPNATITAPTKRQQG